MKFSVIMPSYLGEYKEAASGRDWKIVRAVNSVLKQKYKDFELLIIADGCKKTVEIIKKNFAQAMTSQKVRLYEIPKQKKWSGQVRNIGLKFAKGEWICYLDIDDIFGDTHLERLNKGIETHPTANWVFFNDFSYNKERKVFVEHFINIHVKGKCGTSNIAHKRNLNVRWPVNSNYMHDWHFITELKKRCKKFIQIDSPRYCICHVPGLLDV